MKNLKIFRKNLNALSKVKDPNELFVFIENKVVSFFGLSSLSVFGLNNSGEMYTCIDSLAATSDMSKILKTINFNLDNPIIKNLLDTQELISVKEISKNITYALTDTRRKLLFSLNDELTKIKAKVCIPGFVENKLLLIFVLGEKASQEEFNSEELELFSLLAKKSAKIIDSYNLLKEKIELFVQSMRITNDRLEKKDHYTRGHSHRVEEFSMIMGKKLQSELDKIPYGEIILYYAAEFHDVGKINTPDSILKKNGPLNKEEFTKIKEHPVDSVKILKPMKKWFGKVMLDAILYHHENYDGTGYPQGKKENEINILARIIRVADSFDAMITDRPYRKALIQHQALLELKNGKGTQFDPKVVDVFLEAYREGLFTDIFSQIAHISKTKPEV